MTLGEKVHLKAILSEPAIMAYASWGSNSISNTVVENQIGVGMLNGNIANLQDGVYIGEGASYNVVGWTFGTTPAPVPIILAMGLGTKFGIMDVME